MPSLAHQVLTRVIPVLRGSGEVVDAEELRRDVLARQGDPSSPPRWGLRGCTVTARTDQPFPVWDLLPPGPEPSRTVLYLHGGGFIGHVDPFQWWMAAGLARATKARFVVPAYPLTPIHTWRDSHPPLLRLIEQLAVESPHGVVLMGDSAGGGLALALAQQVARAPGPQPTGLVLISPWVDLTGDTPGTEQARAADPWLTLSKLRLYGGWWAGEDAVDRPEVSPLHGDYAGLPRTLVLCGTRDLLLPQVRAAVERLRAAEVPVTYVEKSGLLHVYPVLPVPEAKAARRTIADFVVAL
ncbi:MAG: alpha/beta hydrolase [Nocardioides sp.]